MIDQFTNDGYYVNTGKFFPRIVSNFGQTGFFVVQGGAATLNGSGTSGQPGTPFPNENLQQLPLSGINQIAMANSGGTDSNDTQFFINTGSLNSALGYGFTVFGQLLTGTNTLGQMTQIPVMNNTSTGEHSQPVNPLTITSATLSATNPNGVLLLDTTQAHQGETSTITVTATDPADHTTVVQSFVVTVGAYGGPQNPTINFRPFANPSVGTVAEDASGQIQLNGQSGYPGTPASTLTYSLVGQPSHGTISNFNPSTGTFTYTPTPGFLGTDSLQYQVTATGPQTTPATTVSNPGKVTIEVGPLFTGSVQVIGTALVVQPMPKFHGKNHIHIAQIASASASGGAIIQVNINGQLDATQPAIGTIDRIIVMGGRTARNQVVVDPSVKVSTTIDSGHGTVAFITGGGGPSPRTRMVRAFDVDRRSRPESAHRPCRQGQIQTVQGDRFDLRRRTTPPHRLAQYVATGRNVLQVHRRSSRPDLRKRGEGRQHQGQPARARRGRRTSDATHPTESHLTQTTVRTFDERMIE